MVENIDTIPSYKFLCVLNQLTAQLNSKHSKFTEAISNILARCIEEHYQIALYHLLPIIFEENGDKSKSKEQRVQITKEILTKVSKNKNIRKALSEMENMFSILIEFANTQVKDSFPKIKSLHNLSSTQVPTIALNVSRSGNYEITSVQKWNEKFAMCGGINAPKRISCLGSDGVSRSQLLKGKDDLRQDAVMQQVFGAVNELLRSDKTTSQNKMDIRTYRIVPLSKVIFLFLEFVYLNTMFLILFII